MRVLHIAYFDNKCGGIERVILNWNDNIDHKKLQFDFAIPTKHTIFEDKLKAYGGEVFYLPSELRHPFQYKKGLKKIIEDEKYDAIHIHKNSLCNSWVFCTVKSLKIPKIILHAHNTAATGNLKWLKNMIHHLNFYWVKRMVTDKVSCSKVAAEWMFGKKAVAKNEIIYIQNAVDIEMFQYNKEIREKKRKELGFKQEEFVVGYTARFSKEKNHKFLLDIFYILEQKNPNARLLLVGDGKLQQDIRNKALEYGIEKKVVFTGNRSDVNELYQAMDCFVMPSLHEGLPLAGIEAQASGLPCFFSDNVTLELGITENVKYLSLNMGAEKWADEISKLHHPEREQAYKTIISAGYSIDQIISNVEKIYM